MDLSHSIVLTDVNHFFTGKQVLHGINLLIPKGLIYGLLGPSGCGKTTTVKIMAGIMEATSGTVTVKDTQMPNLQMMHSLGYMAQSDALYPSLTAEENLFFFGSLYNVPKEKLKNKIIEVMELVNLKDHLHKATGAYSGGMKRRLSLAISLLHEPDILILDEPTVGIDPILRKSIWDALNIMIDQGMTIIVTTHVMDEAEKCHQLAMMRDGFLIAVGTPKKLIIDIGAENIEQAFIKYGKAD